MIRPFARCWNSQCKWASGSKRGMGSRQLTGRPWDNQGGALVSCEPKTQFDAMKTQFRRNAGVKCLTDKDFPSRPKTQFDPIKTQLQPNAVTSRHRTLWLVTQRIRRVVGQFTDNLPTAFRNLPSQPVPCSPNLPIIYRFSPVIYQCSWVTQ